MLVNFFFTVEADITELRIYPTCTIFGISLFFYTFFNTRRYVMVFFLFYNIFLYA